MLKPRFQDLHDKIEVKEFKACEGHIINSVIHEIMNKTQLRVGLCIAESKRRKLDLPGSLLALCKNENISLIDIDLEIPIERQGPFDVILHKILEFRHENLQKGDEFLRRFVAYLNEHKDITLLDPMPTCTMLADRFLTMSSVKKCEFRSESVGKEVFVPQFCFIDVSCNNIASIKSIVTENSLYYPLIVKHVMGASLGKEAHEMSIIFDENGLVDLKTPCFLQQFCNHNGYMLKIYTVGEKYYICKRPSIRDLTAGSFPTVYFNSSDISKRGKSSPLHNNVSEHSPLLNVVNNEAALIERDIVVELLTRLKHEFTFTLLGIDIIVDKDTGDYGIIDVNYFPGYDGVRDQFHADLVDLLVLTGRHQ